MTKDEYKVKLSWLNAIPRTWDVKPLWSVTRERSTKGKEGELLSVYLDRGVIHATDGSLGTHAPSETMDNYQEVRPGDFILNNQQAWRGSVGVSFESGIISPAYLIFELSDSLDWRYCNYLLRARPMVDQYMLASQGVGSIQRQVHAPSFKNVLMVIPPLDAQKKIAAFLDERTKAIDILVGKKEKLVELLREKRQSLITRIVTKGLDSKSMKSSGVEWLGEIPANWHTDKIISLFDFPNEKVSDKDYEPLSVTYGGVLKQVDDAAKTDNGTNRRLLKVNDIAFNGRSDRQGACGMSDFEGSISVVYHVLRSRSTEVHVRYYHHLFRNTLFSQEFYRWGRGIHDDMWTTRTLEMKKIQVPVPPVSEQQRIANYLDSETLKIDKLASLIESSIKQLREYRRALLYAAVTGKVNF